MAIRYVDYTPDTAKRLPGTDNVCVAEAWLYSKDKKKNMGIYFIVTGPQLKTVVTIEKAIETAKEKRGPIAEEYDKDPQWGENAYYYWDGLFFRWEYQWGENA